MCLWLGPPWFGCWFSFTLTYSGTGRKYSSLFVVVFSLIFMFSDALAGLGAFVRARFLCVSVLGVASGPGVELAGYEGVLEPRWFALLAVPGQ